MTRDIIYKCLKLQRKLLFSVCAKATTKIEINSVCDTIGHQIIDVKELLQYILNWQNESAYFMKS